MITSIRLEYPLAYHERKILERICDGSNGLTPPFTLLEDQAGIELLYDLSGLRPLATYSPGCVGDAFDILRSCVLAFRAATDRMLKPEYFFTNPEHVYIAGRGVRLLYGGFSSTKHAGRLPCADAHKNSCADTCTHIACQFQPTSNCPETLSGADAYEGNNCEAAFLQSSSADAGHSLYALLRPALAALRGSDALGVRDAMTQIEEKIRSRNAGFSEIFTLIEEMEREWNYILPR